MRILRAAAAPLVLAWACALACSWAGTAHAQSRYLPLGHSGGLVAAGVGTGGDWSTLGGQVGYSFGGRFDVGLELSRATAEENFLDYTGDMEIRELAPFVVASLTQPGGGAPLGAELGGSLGLARVTSDYMDTFGASMARRRLNLWAELYTVVALSPSCSLCPRGGLGVTLESNRYDNDGHSSDTYDENNGVVRAACALVCAQRWVLTPAWQSYDEVDTWSVSIGLLLPQAPRRR